MSMHLRVSASWLAKLDRTPFVSRINGRQGLLGPRRSDALTGGIAAVRPRRSEGRQSAPSAKAAINRRSDNLSR